MEKLIVHRVVTLGTKEETSCLESNLCIFRNKRKSGCLVKLYLTLGTKGKIWFQQSALVTPENKGKTVHYCFELFGVNS